MSIEPDKLNELLATYRAWKRLTTIAQETNLQVSQISIRLNNLCGQTLRGRVLAEHEDLLRFYPHAFFYIGEGGVCITSMPDVQWVKEGRVYYDEASALAMLPESNGRRADESDIPTRQGPCTLLGSSEDATPYWITLNSPF